jgi:hypothetical protein
MFKNLLLVTLRAATTTFPLGLDMLVNLVVWLPLKKFLCPRRKQQPGPQKERNGHGSSIVLRAPILLLLSHPRIDTSLFPVEEPLCTLQLPSNPLLHPKMRIQSESQDERHP